MFHLLSAGCCIGVSFQTCKQYSFPATLIQIKRADGAHDEAVVYKQQD